MSVRLHTPVVVTDGGPWAEHDHACAVCRVAKAVLVLDTGVFHPCWACQADGWQLVRRRRWQRPLLRLRARARRVAVV